MGLIDETAERKTVSRAGRTRCPNILPKILPVSELLPGTAAPPAKTDPGQALYAGGTATAQAAYSRKSYNSPAGKPGENGGNGGRRQSAVSREPGTGTGTGGRETSILGGSQLVSDHAPGLGNARGLLLGVLP